MTVSQIKPEVCIFLLTTGDCLHGLQKSCKNVSMRIKTIESGILHTNHYSNSSKQGSHFKLGAEHSFDFGNQVEDSIVAGIFYLLSYYAVWGI